MKRIRLETKQIDRLSEFMSNVGVVTLAAALIPLISGEEIALAFAAESIVLSAVSLVTSLALLRI